MADSGKNDSVGAGKGGEVRLRGFDKKGTEAVAPAAPADAPRSSTVNPVRFRARAGQTADAPAMPVEEPVLPDTAPAVGVENSAGTFDVAESVGVEVPLEVAEPVPAPELPHVSSPASGIRVRVPPKEANSGPEPVLTESRTSADAQSRSSQGSGPQPAYVPDTDEETINRRRWWKYDLRVKSGRVQPQGGQ